MPNSHINLRIYRSIIFLRQAMTTLEASVVKHFKDSTRGARTDKVLIDAVKDGSACQFPFVNFFKGIVHSDTMSTWLVIKIGQGAKDAEILKKE